VNNEEIINDFRRRYEGTFIQLCAEQKGMKVLGKMQRVRADPDKFASLEIMTREFGTVQMNMGSDEYQIKFEFPQAGIFQYRDQACGFIRKAEKQYQRGLSAGNSRLLTSTAGITGGALALDLYTVQAAFDHKQYTLAEGLKMLRDGEAKSVALHDDWSVTLPMRKNGAHFVFHNFTLVGSCSDKGKPIRLYQPIYEKAFTELLNG